MRKKILATLMIVGLLAAQTLTVCAAGSAVTGVTVSSGYTVAIDAKNGEEKNLTEMVKNSPEEVKKAVEGKTALTPVMDVKAGTAEKDANGKYVVTFNVQNLTSSVKNVTVLPLQRNCMGSSRVQLRCSSQDCNCQVRKPVSGCHCR